ncbi:unnamed protein product [Moneuplotes crassus]|uniref:tRNA/rRNA methyltransferase SpoU type domain-containing protein n=2 Tax=Euplotes crassus TaxID=5936 RepID=A0AAD1XU94_EUPCR|nr:unnamed protein product [Moneuplotes crassus]
MEQDSKVENQLEEETKDIPKEQNPGCPKSYLLHFNISKQKNFGRLVRSAAAFGVSEIFVVNSGKGKLDLFGHQGTAKHMDFRFFKKLKEVKEYCNENKISICGIEIIEGAEPVHKMPFRGDTLFMLGNEGTGLNQNQIDVCDQFVYIGQYTGKTASLNVACAGSIILHSFAVWANFQEHTRVGYKYEEDQVDGNSHSNIRSVLNHDADQVREERQRLKEMNDKAMDDGAAVEGIGDIFGEDP